MARLPIQTYKFTDAGELIETTPNSDLIRYIRHPGILKLTGLKLDPSTLTRHAMYVDMNIWNLTLKCIPGRTVKSQLWALAYQDTVLMSHTVCKVGNSYTNFIVETLSDVSIA